LVVVTAVAGLKKLTAVRWLMEQAEASAAEVPFRDLLYASPAAELARLLMN
jgi:hypothetical protein